MALSSVNPLDALTADDGCNAVARSEAYDERVFSVLYGNRRLAGRAAGRCTWQRCVQV